MIIAGLRLTRGGGIALLRDDTLELGVETEHLDDNPRGSVVGDLGWVPRLLAEGQYGVDDIDEWAVDGWYGRHRGELRLRSGDAMVELTRAPYGDTTALPEPLRPGFQGRFELGGKARPYASYVHVAGHLAAAYCTSPFAGTGTPSMVLVWDSGSLPLLYHVDADGRVEPGGALFPLVGEALAATVRHFGSTVLREQHLTSGTGSEDVKKTLRELFHAHFTGDTAGAREYRATVIGGGSTAEPSLRYVRGYLDELGERTARLGAGYDDVLASVHELTGELLVEHLDDRVRAWTGGEPYHLCFAGSRALDAGRNSALRGHPTVRAMWIPPFPDESGSAVGAAAIHASRGGGLRKLSWRLRSGPALRRPAHVPAGWSVSPCRPEELARLLHRTGRPAVVLAGRAKLGPRALGARDILAPLVDPVVRDLLDRGRHRDGYGPVAPICLTERAPDIFDPGTPDPYLQFEHRVRAEWVERLPALRHLGGAARLQTVSPDDDPVLATILREYQVWSGCPVLCAASAGDDGRAAFPDVVSAMRWGEVDTVWGDGILYRRVTRSAP
jgi:carbamoyltransferase